MYSTIIRSDEIELIDLTLADDLDDELFLARLLTRRVAARSTDDLETSELLSLYNALLRGTGRIANLLRQRKALSPEATTFFDHLAEALQELNLPNGNLDQVNPKENPD